MSWWRILSVAAIVLTADVTPSVAIEVHPPLENRVWKALQVRRVIDFKDVPLTDALEWIAQEAGVPVHLDLAAWHDEGIDPSTPVNLQLRDPTLSAALNYLLPPLALTIETTDEWLFVTTQAKSDEVMTTHVFDVGRLVDLLRDRVLPLLPNANPAVFYGMGPGFPQFGGGSYPSATPVVVPVESAVGVRPVEEWLGVLSTELSATGQWEVADSVGGTMSVGHRRLIVRQTKHELRAIANLLNALERMAAEEAPATMVFADESAEDTKRIAATRRSLQQPYSGPTKELALASWVTAELEAGLDVLVDHPALQNEGVNWNELMIRAQKGVSRDTLLQTALAAAGCRYDVIAGLVVITTQSEAYETVTAAVYDVRHVQEAHDSLEIMQTIEKVTSGQWGPIDSVGGNMYMPARGLLVVLQTHRVHGEIAAFLAALRQPNKPEAPAKPALVTRLYPVHDASALPDLRKTLPKLIDAPGAVWPEDAIHAVGQTLLVKQTPDVHRHIENLMRALQQSYELLHPNPPAATTEKPKDPPAK